MYNEVGTNVSFLLSIQTGDLMIKIASVADVRKIEAEADHSGISYDTMMEHAGRALADRILDLASTDQRPSYHTVDWQRQQRR